MADTDVLTRLDKQMEGNSLALSAVAEVLQKMEYRMLRDEESISKQMEEESEATEREALIKAIAGEVVSVIKQGGLDVDGKKTRPAAKTPAYTADTEKPVSPASKIEDQQATIQAMFKNVSDKDDEDEYPKAEKTQHKATDAADEEDEEPKKGYAMKGTDEEDEEGEDSERAPIKNAEDDKDDEEDDEEKGYNKAMAKELDALRKQIAAYEAGMQKAVQDETETRLRKMGFKQETSLQRPLQIEGPAPSGLGVDGTTRLKKGDNSPEDTAEQLMQLSYKDLRELQARIEMGQTDGVPAELLGNG